MGTDTNAVDAGRRPLRSRRAGWAVGISRRVAAAGASPNGISVASVAFAAAAAVAVGATARCGSGVGRAVLFAAAGGLVQLRLLCNLLDGLVAVEGGRGSPAGEVFNDVPDRVSDVLILVAVGVAAGHERVGWVAAVLAVYTAYVRVLGRSLGLATSFAGPMAKQHRMAVVTAGCGVAAAVWRADWQRDAMAAVAWVVVGGCVLTLVRRTGRVVRQLGLGGPA